MWLRACHKQNHRQLSLVITEASHPWFKVVSTNLDYRDRKLDKVHHLSHHFSPLIDSVMQYQRLKGLSSNIPMLVNISSRSHSLGPDKYRPSWMIQVWDHPSGLLKWKFRKLLKMSWLANSLRSKLSWKSKERKVPIIEVEVTLPAMTELLLHKASLHQLNQSLNLSLLTIRTTL
jgi:hypothetical protein